MIEPKRNPNALCIFIKNPILGKVKTRIASSVGDDKALDIYIKLLDITRTTVDNTTYDKYLFYSDVVNDNDAWNNDKYNKHVQTYGNIGNRMFEAFDQLLTMHKKVVLIGSDCPDIDSSILKSSFDFLDDHDLVYGPTYDGGYYLIGLKESRKYLFENIKWSTASVLETSLLIASQHKLKSMLLPKLRDIDHIEDWDAYKAKNAMLP